MTIPDDAESPEPFQRVALRHDLDAHGLKAGDVAVLIDRVPHPAGGEEGVVLEVFNALGESHRRRRARLVDRAAPRG